MVKKCIDKTDRIWQYPKIDSLNGQKDSWRAYGEVWGVLLRKVRENLVPTIP